MTECTRGPFSPRKYSPNDEQASHREKPERRAGQEGGRRAERERGKREAGREKERVVIWARSSARTWRPRLEQSGVRSSGGALEDRPRVFPVKKRGWGALSEREGGGTARLPGEGQLDKKPRPSEQPPPTASKTRGRKRSPMLAQRAAVLWKRDLRRLHVLEHRA